MATDPRLENYLTRLDKALGPIPVSDRADIVTEIRSHVLDALARDAAGDLNGILASLGEPETVASRYLLERGLKPAKPSKSPMVKWLTIGFLGTFAITCLFITVLIWNFTPLISVDEAKGRVVILGGLIDIDEEAGKVKIGSMHIHEDKVRRRFEGSTRVGKDKPIEAMFVSGKFSVSTSVDDTLRWKCKIDGGIDTGHFRDKPSGLTLDLKGTDGAQCDVEVPAGATFKLAGNNGKMEIVRPRFKVEVEADNGEIEFSPDPSMKYRYTISVMNGKSDEFESSPTSDALVVALKLKNGKIERN